MLSKRFYIGILFAIIFPFASCKKPNTIPTPTYSNWPQLGNLTSSEFFNCLCVDKQGNLYTAGVGTAKNNFNNLIGNIYKWNGNAWNQLPSNNSIFFNGDIVSLCADTSGNIYAAGYFTDSTTYFYPAGNAFVGFWNGSVWSILGGKGALNIGTGPINSIAFNETNNSLYAAIANGPNADVYIWNGHIWAPLDNSGNKLNNSIRKLLIDKQGNIFVGGEFTNTNGKQFVAKWNGNSWVELGSGTNSLNANGFIYDIEEDASGNIYASGNFTNANGKHYVARWDGTTWSELGGTNALNANGVIYTIAFDNSGNLYAGGGFYYTVNYLNQKYTNYIAKWDGTNWSIVGKNYLLATLGISSGTSTAGGGNDGFTDILINSSGTIFSVGDFTNQNQFFYIGHYP